MSQIMAYSLKDESIHILIFTERLIKCTLMGTMKLQSSLNEKLLDRSISQDTL